MALSLDWEIGLEFDQDLKIKVVLILLSEKPLYNYQLYLAFQTLTVILVAGEGGGGEKCVCMRVCGGGRGSIDFQYKRSNIFTGTRHPT